MPDTAAVSADAGAPPPGVVLRDVGTPGLSVEPACLSEESNSEKPSPLPDRIGFGVHV